MFHEFFTNDPLLLISLSSLIFKQFSGIRFNLRNSLNISINCGFQSQKVELFEKFEIITHNSFFDNAVFYSFTTHPLKLLTYCNVWTQKIDNTSIRNLHCQNIKSGIEYIHWVITLWYSLHRRWSLYQNNTEPKQ